MKNTKFLHNTPSDQMSTLCEFYVTHTAHILAFTTSTNECTQIQQDIHHKIHQYQTLTCFGTRAPSLGSLLEKRIQVQHANPGVNHPHWYN